MSPERISIIYCTAAEGQKFQIEATEIDKTIRKLGPSPLRAKDTPKKEKAKAKAKA
jgi:coenzyme F420-reducing hydrogenase delta subunit